MHADEMSADISEAALRQLRAKVYGECKDDVWLLFREYWMQPENVRWLLEKTDERML
jgi:hypothetical protein